MQKHRGKNILGISTGFIENAAVFTGEEGLEMGDFYKLTLPFHSIYAITSPKIAHHVLVQNSHKYRKSRIYWQQLKTVIGDCMATFEGKEWLEARAMQQPAYKNSSIQQYLSNITYIIDKHIESWDAQLTSSAVLPVGKLLAVLNVEIILKTVFGIDDTENLELVAGSIDDGENILAWRSKYPWRPASGWLSGENIRLIKHKKFFDGFVKKNKNKFKEGLLAHTLYHSLPDSFTEEQKLQRIRNELIVHLGAGTETAAVCMEWTLLLLANHPEILRKAEVEIQEFTSTGSFSYLNYNKLTYTKQVIDESLRLYPPSHSIIRDCIEEDCINGQIIRKGDTVFLSIYGLHRNPRLWGNPDIFDPERFGEVQRKQIPDYTYMPYSIGPQSCIGKYLALPMLVITLAKILQKFSISKADYPDPKPISISTLKPSQPVMVMMQKKF